jgi:hypothetical protein
VERERTPPRPSPEAQKAASDREIQCLIRKSAELDDGISSANVIGHYVGEACHSEIIQSQLLLFQGSTFASKLVTPAYIFEHQDEIVNDTGTRAVLGHRLRKRDSSPAVAGPSLN